MQTACWQRRHSIPARVKRVHREGIRGRTGRAGRLLVQAPGQKRQHVQLRSAQRPAAAAALFGSKTARVLGTRPNISEYHSEISTRVPFCIATSQAKRGERGREVPPAPLAVAIWQWLPRTHTHTHILRDREANAVGCYGPRSFRVCPSPGIAPSKTTGHDLLDCHHSKPLVLARPVVLSGRPSTEQQPNDSRYSST